jgi:hypothetical protein
MIKGKYLVFNVGCIECGVSSNVVGVFTSKADAEALAEKLHDKCNWREGGQNSFEVFELDAEGVITAEYREAVTVDNSDTPIPAHAEVV